MKKVIVFLSCLFLVVGCGKSSAKGEVEEYLSHYQSLSDDVMSSIDDLIKDEGLEGKNKDNYEEVIKRQYRDLKYTIENENCEDDKCDVAVKITVYDLYKVQQDSTKYLSEHRDEFLTNEEYDEDKYLEYKLEKMRNVNETVSYNVVFKVKKVDGKWEVEQPDEETLEKIHGIYNYEK